MLNAHLIAGVLSGVAVSLFLHPLDVLRTRYQVQDGVVNAVRYRDLLSAVRDTWRSEGLRGFYGGLTPALVGSGASWGLYFYFYESCKRRLREGSSGSPAGLTPVQHAYAAWEGGTLTCLLTNPVWLVKTRMQLQVAQGGAGGSGAVAAQGLQPYTSMGHAFASIVRQEGVWGLYRGIVPALFLTLHGVIQFVTYEALKVRFGEATDATLLSAGVLSKVAAVTLTYPYSTIKARLQQRFAGAPEYRGFLDCAGKTWSNEGFRGFYRGFTTNLIRVAPQSALTLLLYERISAAVQARQ
jgi:solute carrier family 25 folate transporter 32